jgi:hypothetical protein
MKYLLIFLGLRSKCCGAPIYDWDSKRSFCENCENKV